MKNSRGICEALPHAPAGLPLRADRSVPSRRKLEMSGRLDFVYSYPYWTFGLVSFLSEIRAGPKRALTITLIRQTKKGGTH